jgi:hypothetical protein
LLLLGCGVFDPVVVPIEFVCCLGVGVGSGMVDSWFANQIQEGSDKDGSSNEGIQHELRGKGQALSFCQQLIQLWLRL